MLKKCIAISLLMLMMPSAWANKTLVFSTIDGLAITTFGERLLKEAYQKIDIDITVEKYPGERSLVAANAGKTDGELGRIAGLEKTYTNLVMVPVPLIELSVSAFSNKNISIDSVKELKKYRVGYVAGTKIVEQMTVDVKDRLPVGRPEQLFEMLLLDRIDVAVHTTEDGLLILQSARYAKIKTAGPPLARSVIYHYLHKKHAHLVPAISKALQEMTDKGVFQKERDDFSAKLKK